MIGSRMNGGNSEYGRVKSDLYPTPPEATAALMGHLKLPRDTVVWECACGKGHMSEELWRQGCRVVSSDIVDRGYGEYTLDFLTGEAPEDFDWIITNPPYALAASFIARCVKYGRPFAMFLKSQFWHAACRYPLFMECPPSEILPLTWRPDFFFGQRGGGSPVMDSLWCVWRRETGTGDTIYIPLRKPDMTGRCQNFAE